MCHALNRRDVYDVFWYKSHKTWFITWVNTLEEFFQMIVQ